MNNLSLNQIISSFDESSDVFSENDIAESLRNQGYQLDDNLETEQNAEILAFNFVENVNHEGPQSETYYGPKMTYQTDEGVIGFPSYKQVTPEIYQYWQTRTSDAKHPILIARYSDLVWDYSLNVIKESADIQFAQRIIDSTICIAEKDLYKYEWLVFIKFERALNIALSINDQKRLSSLIQQLINYEKKVGKDESPGLWGHCYDLLIENKKIEIEVADENFIIQDLEDRLSRFTIQISDKPNINATERAATRLGKYYLQKNQKNEVERVILKIGEVYERINQNAVPLQISARLQLLYSIYVKFGLKKAANDVLVEINNIAPKVSSNLSEFSHEFTITDEEMQKHISFIVECDFYKSLSRIIHEFIPKIQDVARTVENNKKRFPLQYLVTKQLLDERGRPIAKISPDDADPVTSQIIDEFSNQLYLLSVFLRPTIDAFLSKFMINEYNFLLYFLENSIFKELNKETMRKGFHAYFKNDHIQSSHLLIPQIESAFRNIVEVSGGNVLISTRFGGYNYRTLNSILNDPIIKNVFGENLATYFKVLLTDSRGWNLRNNLCHGLLSDNSFNSTVSDRIFHIILILSTVRFEEVE